MTSEAFDIFKNSWVNIKTVTGYVSMRVSHFYGSMKPFDVNSLDEFAKYVYDSLTAYKRAQIKWVIDDGNGGVFFLSRKDANDMTRKIDKLQEKIKVMVN